MQLDLQQLKSTLLSGDEFLIDGGYLDFDIKVLYDYYQSSEVQPPPEIKEYFNSHDSYDFLEFLKCYLKSSLGFEVEFSYTKDGWLKMTYGRTTN